ncbi:MAG: serine/threonine protein kinase [Bradymonadaceae bacterium]
MQQLGPYSLIEQLGAGGMAEIFRARARGQEGFEKDYVLKILHPRLAGDPSFGRMLAEEARLTAYLKHSNVVSVHDLGREGDTLYVVMEYVEGRDLHSLIATMAQSETPFPQEIAAYIARETCAGLHYAHTRRDEDGKSLQLVHRDVSPHNVLISFQGEVKLIDFGVAKIDDQLREKTRAGIIKGKFGYMSPEQAWDATLDGRSDVFSVGICLYEMLTGRSLYGQNEDPVAMIRKVRKADFVSPSTWRQDLDPEFEAILARALAPNRENRYQTALECQKELTAFIARFAPRLTPYDVGQFLSEMVSETDAPVPGSLLSRENTLPEAATEDVGAHESTQPMVKNALDSAPSAPPDEEFAAEKTNIFREDQPTFVPLRPPSSKAQPGDQDTNQRTRTPERERDEAAHETISPGALLQGPRPKPMTAELKAVASDHPINGGSPFELPPGARRGNSNTERVGALELQEPRISAAPKSSSTTTLLRNSLIATILAAVLGAALLVLIGLILVRFVF